MVRAGKIILSDWPPHARFHAVMLLAVGIGLSIVALWLVWRRVPEPRVATVVPVTVWGAYFVPLLVLALVGYRLCARERKT